MRLYRRGKQLDWGSGWFPTIEEAQNHPTKDRIISIMRIQKEAFDKHFEPNGIGYRPKSPKDFAEANPVIETMTEKKFERRLEHPIISRLYTDGTESGYLL